MHHIFSACCQLSSLDCCLCFGELRRKKREEKGEKAPAKTTKRKAAETKAKEPPKKKAKEAETAPDTSNDAEIAAKLTDSRGTGRNRDATGAKSKKASALAKLREVRHRCNGKRDLANKNRILINL